MKKFLIILLIFLSFKLYSSSKYLDIKGANFLKIGVSAKVEGGAGAFTSIGSGDINSIHYNPAGIAGVSNIQFQFSTLDWIDNVSLNYLAFSMPNKKLEGSISSSLIFLYLLPVDYYNSWGEVIDTMSFYNLALSFGYGRILKGYKVGGNLKLVYERIHYKNLLGLAFDFGALYEFEDFSINLFDKYLLIIREFSIGTSLKNIGTKIGADYFPTSWTIGYSFKIIKELKLAVDIVKPIYTFESLIDSDYKVNFGFEYNFKEIFKLRLGYRVNYDIPNNFTLGFGVHTKYKRSELIVDYAYAAYTYLEKTNRISLTLKTKEWRFWR